MIAPKPHHHTDRLAGVPFLAGVVEGFYGRPWTSAQRGELFRWLQRGGLNTYLYAPKDDLKHRALWRERYAPAESRELRALIRGCRRHRLQFFYAIAPGLDLRFSSQSDQAALRAKLAHVRALGGQDFAVLFDDIPAQLGAGDRRRFGTVAAAQAATANGLWLWLRSVRPDTRLLFCPTVYCGRMARPAVRDSAYLRELGEKLDRGIDVLWTGPDIISETIPLDSIREVASVLRRRPVLWDNLHANDYDMRRLYLGPYSGRPANLRAEVKGILLNPNCQFAANFVPVHTLAAYARSGDRWSPPAAYQAALRAWLPAFRTRGSGRIRAADLRLLGDFFHLPTEFGSCARRYLDDIAWLVRNPPGRWGRALARFRRTNRALVALFDQAIGLENRDLFHALYAHLWELKEVVLFLQAWADWRRTEAEPGAGFCAPEFRPQIYRGGFTAAIERLLPMDDRGWFRPVEGQAE